MGKKVVLHHESMSGLQFGPDPISAIQFGPKGGFEPFFAIVDDDHPLLDQLLSSDPEASIWQGPSETQVKIYVCMVDDKEFRTRPAFIKHLQTKGHEELLDAIRARLEAEAAAEDELPAGERALLPAEEPELVGAGA